GVTAAEISLVVTADGDGDDVCRLAAGAALGGEVVGTGLSGGAVEHISIAATYGQCQAAGGAFQAVAALARHRADPARDGRLALLVAHCPTGGVAASVLRGWSRVGAGGR
ncbi:MAG TPA: hypothetical protein VFR67_27650, partial [Pilimelia sp.]|nr:hypothetical protein [Pilimelia sp.]